MKNQRSNHYKLLIIIFISLICTPIYPQKIEHGKRFRTLIIGIDGMKGTQFYEQVFLQKNQAPNIKNVSEYGKYSECLTVKDPHCARTHLGPRFDPRYSWMTSSGWASVLTGVDNNKHLVKDNEFESQRIFYQSTNQFPTFLSTLKRNGFITAAGGVSSFLSSIDAPKSTTKISTGIVDFECGIDVTNKRSNVEAAATHSCNTNYRRSFISHEPLRDKKLTNWMINLINTNNQSPDLIMGVYDTVDSAGHDYGFSSNPHYTKALSQVDNYIGQLIQTIQKRAQSSSEVWLIMITSDHGGHVTTDGHGEHGFTLFHEEVVPFIAAIVGKNISIINKGKMDAMNIKQMDVNPSVLYWFGIKPTVTDGTIRSYYRWL